MNRSPSFVFALTLILAALLGAPEPGLADLSSRVDGETRVEDSSDLSCGATFAGARADSLERVQIAQPSRRVCCCTDVRGQRCCSYAPRCGGPIPGCWCR
jgi:hypothetical protein